MNLSVWTAGLYPVSLALANLGVGVILYLIGAVVFAVLLWVSGALVIMGIVSSVTDTLTRSDDPQIS